MARSSLGFVAMTQRQHEAEASRLSSLCSHCCPNCDGPITVHEHELTGLCTACYWQAVEIEEDAYRRLSFEEWMTAQDAAHIQTLMEDPRLC